MLVDDGLLVREDGRWTVARRYLGGARAADDPGAARGAPRSARRRTSER